MMDYSTWAVDCVERDARGGTRSALGERPQEIANRVILEDSDILIAVFWSRLGRTTC